MNAPLTWAEMGRAGAFTTDQVARLTGVSVRDVGSWLKGKVPLIAPDYLPVSGRLALTFEGLLEARVIAYLLAEGMPKPRVRELASHLRQKLEDRHPLARDRKIVTDGARAFEASDDRLVNLLNDCYADRELMRPALHGRVQYEHGRAAYLIPLPSEFPRVVIDPRRSFGRPVVIEGGKSVPTAALAAAAKRDGLDDAAEWFEVEPDSVAQAVGFEERLAA